MADYYEILGVPRNGTDADIKKAYRKKALKWHPDKNPDNKEEAENRFKEVSEAYEVLSDSNKRQIYNQYGKEGLTGGASTGGAHDYDYDFDFNFGRGHHDGFHSFAFRDPFDVFKDFFEHDPFASHGFDPFFPLGRSRHNQHRPRRHGGGPNRERQVSSNFHEQTFGFPSFGFSHQSFFSDPFGHDPFMDAGRRQRRRQRNMHMAGPSFSLFSMDPFGAFSSGVSSFSSSSFGGASGGGAFRSTSRSTKIVNGKKVVTTKVMENGMETVSVEEDGILTSKTVNGQPQAIAY